MSRCFPFPPPGYDKKDRPDDVNLIIKEKEKHKQKKNKDKKDKDKKERSERKEKERSEHKGDKERKQKKHKEKKDKHKSSNEKKIVQGSLDNQNGDQILYELGKRVRNDDEATENRTVHKSTLVEENSDRMLPNRQNLGFGSKGFENGFVGNFPRENQGKVEGISLACELEKIEKKKEGKEKSKERKSDGKGDGRKNEDRETKRKKEKKKEEKERSKEEIKQRQNGDSFLDCRGPLDLLKDKRDSHGNLPKLKEPQLNGFLHDNETRLGNMSGHAFLSHQVGQNGSGIHSSQNVINSSVEKGPVVTNHKGIHSSPKTINSSMENGPMITNHKASGILSSPQPVIKNPRNVGPGQSPSKFTPNNHVMKNGLISSSDVAKVNRKAGDKSHSFSENDKEKMEPKVDKGVNLQGPDFNRKMEHKEVKINGISEGKKRTSSKAKEKFDASMKPPHPDSKYLSQILDIPKVEWPQFDDEEWLFGCKDTKRPKLASSSEIEWTKPVWAEAIRLEPEDVIAMPYVIPY